MAIGKDDTFVAQIPRHIGELVDALARAADRSKVMNIHPLGDTRAHGRDNWENVDPQFLSSPGEAEAASADHLVACFDVLRAVPNPARYTDFLAASYRRGALIVTTVPEIEADDRDILEQSLSRYRAQLLEAGLSPFFVGTLDNMSPESTVRLVSIHEPRLRPRFGEVAQRPLAIMSCYNEADVLWEVIEHWIAEGCCLHILDNWSTDQSWQLLLAAAERFGDLVTIERFPAREPASGSWQDILQRKEEIAAVHRGRWIIHTDADEIRRSPFMPFNLADALAIVASAGWNRIDFTVLNHRPIDDRPVGPGTLVASLPYFEYGTKPGHFIQKKAWIQGDRRVNLSGSGGHVAEFDGARDCPYKFVLHHFPLRSPEHARRKINIERVGRWSVDEVQRGWHGHYSDLVGSERIVWEPEQLYDSREYFWEHHGLRILLGLHAESQNVS